MSLLLLTEGVSVRIPQRNLHALKTVKEVVTYSVLFVEFVHFIKNSLEVRKVV